jgi:dTDP-4-dehydrorhamnose 3,5-epimerase
MIFTPIPLKGSYHIHLTPFADDRGWFARTYSKDEFAEIGFNSEWVQMNHSYTAEKGTIRGMHYQESPHKEIKLVRCIRGSVFDVIIDLRKDSESFLKWYGVELSDNRKSMMYIPEGFAHGFQTLTADCELLYNHSSYYVPGVEKGIRYNDPKVNISWPLGVTKISERDANHPSISGNFNGI